MSGNYEGYPMTTALQMAVTASEDLKLAFNDADIHDVHVVATASGWGERLLYGHPNIAIFLPEGADANSITMKIAPLAAEIEKRGVRVALYPHDKWAK